MGSRQEHGLWSDRPEFKSCLCHLLPLWFVANGLPSGLKSSSVNWYNDDTLPDCNENSIYKAQIFASGLTPAQHSVKAIVFLSHMTSFSKSPPFC